MTHIINKNDLVNSMQLKQIFCKYKNLKGVVLYGSVATGKNKATSDIDIMLVWNKYNDIFKDMIDIEIQIKKIYNKEIELVSIRYNEKYNINDTHNNSIDYINNVCNEGIVLYGRIEGMKDSYCDLYNFKEIDKFKLKDLKKK